MTSLYWIRAQKSLCWSISSIPLFCSPEAVVWSICYLTMTQKPKGRPSGYPGLHWGRWRLYSTSPVTTRAVAHDLSVSEVMSLLTGMTNWHGFDDLNLDELSTWCWVRVINCSMSCTILNVHEIYYDFTIQATFPFTRPCPPWRWRQYCGCVWSVSLW